MKKLQIRRPVLLLAGLVLLLQRDPLGLVRMALLASVLHEAGHVGVFLFYKHRWPALTISVRGIGMQLSGEWFTPCQQLWLAAAGPLANFVVSAAACLFLQYKASYAGYFFACANLCVGFFNLLPLGWLDGRRILQALRQGR